MAGVFNATTSRGNCALSGKPIYVGDPCFFLVLRGNKLAGPAAQIITSTKDDGYDTGFRSVKPRFRSGEWKVQERVSGRWVNVVTWSKVVLLTEALKRGFRHPGAARTNYKGARTTGVEHSHEADEAVNVEAMEDVDVTLPALPNASAHEAEATIAKIQAGIAKMPPASEPTMEDVANAFASWGQ